MSAEGELVRKEVALAFTASFQEYIKALRETEMAVKLTVFWTWQAASAADLVADNIMAFLERTKTEGLVTAGRE